MANKVDGGFQRIETLPGKLRFQYEDCFVTYSVGQEAITGFYVNHERADRSWPENELSPDQLKQIAKDVMTAAGHSDVLSVIQAQKWGGAGADFPYGSLNRYRIMARRERSGVMSGFGVNAEFDIDAFTGQLLSLHVVPSPTLPASLFPLLRRDAALATVLSAYFAENPRIEIAEESPWECQLTVCHPKLQIPVGDSNVPGYVRQAADAGRGILSYEMVLRDSEEAIAYAAVDARSGQIMYRAHFSRGLGALEKPLRTSKWHWGGGSVQVLSKGKRFVAKGGDIVEIDEPKGLSTGRSIILLRSGIAVQARFHAKENLLSRATTAGTIYGRPNAALLQILRLATAKS